MKTPRKIAYLLLIMIAAIVCFTVMSCQEAAQPKYNYISIDGHVSSGPTEKAAYDNLLLVNYEVKKKTEVMNGFCSQYACDTAIIKYKYSISTFNITNTTKDEN